MPFTSVETAFCVLECGRTQSIKTARRIFTERFERKASGKAPDKNKPGDCIKSLRKKVACAELKYLAESQCHKKRYSLDNIR